MAGTADWRCGWLADPCECLRTSWSERHSRSHTDHDVCAATTTQQWSLHNRWMLITVSLACHADLDRHLTLMKVRSDPTCPLCQEEEETALHLLGRCSALSTTRLTLLGLYRMHYTTYVGRYSWSLPKLPGDFFSLWLIGEAQWAHLVVLALDVLPTGDIHPKGKVR